MKNKLLITCAISILSSSFALTTSALAAPAPTHEATGSLSTTSVATVVTPATLPTVSTISGTVTSASSVTVNTGADIVFTPVGSVRVTIPAATVITPATGTGFDTTAIVSTGAVVSSGLGVNEVSNGAVEFGISNIGLNFSAPIKIEIPVPGYTGTTIAVKVKHGGTTTYVTTGLTNDPNTTCSLGLPNPLAASSTATVTGAIATIYTCSASTFSAVTTVTPVIIYGGGGGGGGSYIVLPTTTTTGATIVTSSGTTSLVNKLTKKLIVKKTPVKKTTTTTTKTPADIKIVKKVVEKKPVEIIAKSLYTNSSRVNIYLAADTKAKFIGYFTKNIKVTVVEEKGDWVKVSTATFSGWAKRSLFRSPTETEVKTILRDADKVIPYVLYTNKGRVNVRLAGDKTAKFLGYFGNNTKVEVIGDGIEWLNVTSKNLTGWSKKADFREPKANEDATIKIAK